MFQYDMAERESQSPLKDKAFSTFLDQNPPFELRRNRRFASNLFMKFIVAHPSAGPTLQFPSAVTVRLIGVCPPKAKVTRSNRVGCATSVQNWARQNPPFLRLKRRRACDWQRIAGSPDASATDECEISVSRLPGDRRIVASFSR
jgi:hypothetical protein